ncbi:MAG: DUF2231 domain-containing protein [Bacteroidales bacterium]|nr:hypothetical protein [Bacteroidales bacterium]HPO66142.1 hypothetical protein [Bacteroidales bacterium]
MRAIVQRFAMCLILSFPLWVLSAHEHHKKDTVPVSVDMEKVLSEVSTASDKHKSFPTLHPLVVHFPIVLLLLASILQVLRVVLKKKRWDDMILYLLAGGIITAYLAGEVFHPHTEGLSSHATIILERHELFASLAMFSALAALLSKITAMYFYRKRQLMLEMITAVILLVAAASVSVSGHWGAYLTHIEGVGPQGKFLENPSSE